MDTRELFISALNYATEAVHMVKAGDFNKSTPDTEWDVKALVAHVIYELAWTADIVNGLTIKEVGDKYDGDLIKDDLQANWRRCAAAARKAVNDCKLSSVAHLSWMDTNVDFYLKQAGADQLIHSWDLSAALSRPLKFDEDIANAVFSASFKDRSQNTAGGLFKPPLTVPKESDIETRLLALFGRDINWQP